jgi:molybdate transport system substrate-binding protein
VIALVLALLCSPLQAETVTVAVAANLLPTAEKLVAGYGAVSDDTVNLAHGSTGRLYAQIRAGAPFDIFLSADAARPALLAEQGLGGDPRAYALGRAVLVAVPGILQGDLAETLKGRRLAIADAAVAPYGLAAEQALGALGVDLSLSNLITGDSVGQVAGFVVTGNVDAAVIALSQLPQVLAQRPLEHRVLDSALHDPIRQDGLLLNRGADNPAAVAFWQWLAGDDASAILRGDGYEVPAR